MHIFYRLAISLLLATIAAAETGGLVELNTITYGSNQLSAADAGVESGHSWDVAGDWSRGNRPL